MKAEGEQVERERRSVGVGGNRRTEEQRQSKGIIHIHENIVRKHVSSESILRKRKFFLCESQASLRS